MLFHEERFPARLSKGAIGGPERRTEIFTLKSGFEERNTPWQHSRRRFDAGVAVQSLGDMHDVISFFEVCRGRLTAFRWKDWSDYKSCAPNRACSEIDQDIAVGDGTTTQFQLIKTYRSGANTYCRKITKPVAATVQIAIAGDALIEEEHFTVDTVTGIVHFAEAPAESAIISAGYEFDVPVRFDTDQLDVSVLSLDAGDIPNIPVIEVFL